MANPYLNANLYVDPTNSAKLHADSIRAANPDRAAMFDKIGNNPVAMWAGGWIPAGTETAWIKQRVDAAEAQGSIGTFVIYNAPVRDAGGFSGGGATDWPTYYGWLERILAGFEGRSGIIIYEPDALGHLPQLTTTDRAAREAGMATAIQDLTNAGMSVYIDAGHDNWHSAELTASLLLEVGVENARGIALNTSNFRATPGLETFGQDVITRTGLPLAMVIDTSRNGLGPDPDANPFNPPGRALGFKPSVNSTNPYVDAYIWVKSPGESDGDDGSYQTAEGEVGDATNGTIAPIAGDFWPNYAYGLAKRATWEAEPSVPSPSSFSSIVDTFDDGVLAPVWSMSAGVVEENGQVTIISDATYSSLQTDHIWSIADSEISAEIFPATGAGSTTAYTVMAIESSTGGTRVGIDYRPLAGTIRFANDVGWWDDNAVSLPYNATEMAWWRIRESSGQTYLETSPDGSTWTIRHQFATPAWVFDNTSRLQILCYQDAGTSIGYVDNVNPVLAQPEPEPEPEPEPNPEPSTGTVVTAESSPTVISGLSPNTNYQMRIRAKNSAGTSAYSAWIPFKTAGTVINVDFATARANSALSTMSFGSCISTYSGDGQNVNIIKGTTAESTDWKNKLSELGPVVWRIPLAWNGGNPGSSAGGARTQGDADEYIAAIKSIGGTPMIAVGGTTGDNDILAADAANLVKFFNDNGGQNGGPVDNWIIGNEPDNDGTGMSLYINGNGTTHSGFNNIVSAMRAATNRPLTIAGPALVTYADYKEGDYNAFFDACGGNVDVIDFHMYDGANLIKHTQAINWFNQAIASRPNMAGRVKVQLGEYNWNPFYAEPDNGANQFLTSRNTVAGAITNGRLVESGGRAYQYSDNNGPLGMITPGNGLNGTPDGYRLPTPAFYGVKMWTGGNLFRRPTGNMATCTTLNNNLEVFASTGDKNIVVANKNETDSFDVTLNLSGTTSSGTYEIWQTAKGFDPADVNGSQWKDPVRVASGTYSNGKIDFSAPAATVSTILVGV